MGGWIDVNRVELCDGEGEGERDKTQIADAC